MVLYITYNDAPGGIYNSQVVDVVKCWQTNLNTPTQLVSFVSIRKYSEYRKKIKTAYPTSIVLPMFPKVLLWRFNALVVWLLVLKYKPITIVGRSVFATQLGLMNKRYFKHLKIVYDGRGAITAEVKEYNVGNGKIKSKLIEKLEKKAVLNSDFNIAVSHPLVKYWQANFGYKGNNFTVIPCTVEESFLTSELIEINSPQIKVAYAGSLAGWQSVQEINTLVLNMLANNANATFLFLCEHSTIITDLRILFPNRVFQKTVEHSAIKTELQNCDYGILYRENSVTNNVASPVKFGEYLSCGLQVIISPAIGDCSKQVHEHNLGIVINDLNVPIHLTKPSNESRLFNKRFAIENYNKTNPTIIARYKTVLQ
jgi:hypothetical protein